MAERRVKKNSSIRRWYIKTFPSDEMGERIVNISFSRLIEEMKRGRDVYEILGVDDSLVRERVFSGAVASGCVQDYDEIYDLWLERDKILRQRRELVAFC